MINRANRIVIVGPHYSGPIMNIADGIRKLAPCTIVAPTNQINRFNLGRTDISPKDLDWCIQHKYAYLRSPDILQFRSTVTAEIVDEYFNVSPEAKATIRGSLQLPLLDQGGYRTGKVRETDILGIDCPAIEGNPGDLTKIINFANKFWELFRQGVFWGAKRVEGHDDLGGFVLFLKPPDIKIRTVFFPYDPDLNYPIASENEAAAFGGHDPYTGCKHYDGMNGVKAGMLAATRTVFWNPREFSGFCDCAHFQGFLEWMMRTGKISITGDPIFKREVATPGSPLYNVSAFTEALVERGWSPTAPSEMPANVAQKYISL